MAAEAAVNEGAKALFEHFRYDVGRCNWKRAEFPGGRREKWSPGGLRDAVPSISVRHDAVNRQAASAAAMGEGTRCLCNRERLRRRIPLWQPADSVLTKFGRARSRRLCGNVFENLDAVLPPQLCRAAPQADGGVSRAAHAQDEAALSARRKHDALLDAIASSFRDNVDVVGAGSGLHVVLRVATGWRKRGWCLKKGNPSGESSFGKFMRSTSITRRARTSKPLEEKIIKDVHAILTENIVVGGIYRNVELYFRGRPYASCSE